MDIHASSGTVIAVGSLTDPALILDESSEERGFSYAVSESNIAPMINIYHSDVTVLPKYYAVDFGDNESGGHKFMDVAILADENNKLQTYENDWNVAPYNAENEFYFAVMTKTKVCLFKATIADVSITSIDTYSYEFLISPGELDKPHPHRLSFDWITQSLSSSTPTDSRPIIFIATPMNPFQLFSKVQIGILTPFTY